MKPNHLLSISFEGEAGKTFDIAPVCGDDGAALGRMMGVKVRPSDTVVEQSNLRRAE